jgi:polyphosphate kinase
VGAVDRFVLLEDVRANNLDVLFADVEVHSCEVFRVEASILYLMWM